MKSFLSLVWWWMHACVCYLLFAQGTMKGVKEVDYCSSYDTVNKRCIEEEKNDGGAGTR
jgi:hypothetical protein